MKRKLNLFLILMMSFALVLSVTAIGCGGDDDPADGDVDGDVTDGDEDGDVTDGDVELDGDVEVDGDEVEPDPEVTECDPACDAAAGMVCENGSCVEIAGTACTTDADCADGEICGDKQANQDCKICQAACSAEDDTCPAGYECIVAASLCYPTATFQGCPDVEMRNVECNAETAVADCPVDTACITNPTIEAKYPWGWCAAQCSTDDDCVQNSSFEEACVNIGANVCLAKCNEHDDCPENVDCMDPFGFGFNVCSHQAVFFEDGTLPPGETCGGGSQESCAFGGMCLGSSQMGYQCLAACDDHHGEFNCTDSQYCQHLASSTGTFTFGYCIDCGDQAPGAACTFGDLHADAGECSCIDGVGSACLGIHPDNINPAERTACETAEDCGGSYDPHPDCVAATDDGNTYCGTSFCAPMCDEAGSCAYVESDDYDFLAQDLQGQCFCFPTPKGTQEPGQACTFGTINAEAGHCVSGSACLGIDPAQMTTPDACETAADCDAGQYVTGIECVDVTSPAGTFCASSFCSPQCVDNGCDHVEDTNFNWNPATISGQCYCLPQPVGTQTAGQPCAVGEFNAESGACALGLSCVGSVDSQSTCTEVGDCNHGPNADCATYTPEGGTADDYCGFSWCSKACETAADCADFGEGACCAEGAEGNNWCAAADYCSAE
jgi:hypothetical protein